MLDRLKHFCGLEIDVREKPHHSDNRQQSDQSENEGSETGKMLIESPDALRRTNKKSAYDAPHPGESAGPSRQVMATFTSQNEPQHLRFKIPLSGLSGGEVELVMVFCALFLSGADNVLLDEPGHSLHPPMQAQLRRYLETQRPAGQTCVVVSHSVEFISPQSLRCLYHMSASGTGFTPRRLRVDCAIQKKERSRQSSPSFHLSQTTITMLMRPDMRKMFFATGLYLVEGQADKRVLSAMRHVLMEDAGAVLEKSRDPRELNQAMKVQEMDRWDILELGGCGDAVKAYKAAASLKIPCAVVLDFDTMTVKHGTEVQEFNRAGWEKSTLYKALKSVEESLLEQVENIFSEGKEDSKISERARKVMRKHGFFIWEIDLEAAICSPQTRKNLLETENFLEIVGVQRPRPSSHDSRKTMSIDAAQENYDRRVLAVFRPLINNLVAELEVAWKKIASEGESLVPVTPVTDRVKEVIEEISKKKQVLSQHDKFVEKGTQRAGGAGKEGEACGSTEQPCVQRSREKTDEEREQAWQSFFWKQIKQKLHDDGWARMPWETLLEVLRVCLQDEQSPLAELCRFMKQRQIKGQKRKQEFPQHLISRILGPTDDSDVDDST